MDSSSDDLAGSRLAYSVSSSSSSSSAAAVDLHCTCSSASAEAMKPEPRDLTHLYSRATKLRQPSKMKEYYKFFQIPGIGNLAGGESLLSPRLRVGRRLLTIAGLPNVQFFPYDTLEAKIAKPERWTPSPNKQGGVDSEDEDAVFVSEGVAAVSLNAPSAPLSSSPPSSASSDPSDRTAPAHLVVPKSAPAGPTPPDKKIDLATALQYGSADGYPPLLSWIREFACEHLHPNVPYKGGADVILTVGSTDGFNKTLELFVDNWSPEHDDVRDRPGLLCETFVYGNVLSQVAPKGMQVVPVKADAGGMVAYGPGGLEDVLLNWDETQGRRPHLLYTVT